MQIEVNVTDVDLTTVVERDYEGAPTTLGDLVAEKLVRDAVEHGAWGAARQRIEQIRDEEIRARVVPLVVEAFEKPIQRTSAYGDPVGAAVTLRDIVLEEAKKVLSGAVGNSYDRQEPLARKLVREMVAKELTAQLAEAIKEERAKVVAAVRAQAAELIAEAVTKGVSGK